MTVSRRSLVTGAVGAGALAGLSGCGFGAASSGSTAAASSGTATRSGGPVKGSLTFSFWGGSDGETKGFTYVKEQFEKKYPGTSVKFNVTPYEGFFAGIDRGLQAGNAPDVFRVDYTTLGKYSSKQVLLDLGPYLDSGTEDEFLPALWQAVKYQDKVYGLPHQTDTSCIVYDRAALAAAGVTSVPTSLDSAWTFEEFAGVARKLRASLPASTFPFAYNWTAAGAFRWLTWLNAAGGSLLTPDLTKPAIPSEAGTKALEYTQSFFTNRWVPASNTIKGAKYSDEFFLAKTVAMAFIGDFSVPTLADPKTGYKGDWGATFLPRDVSASSDLGGNAIVVNAQAKNPELAAAFVSFLGSEDMMKYFCEQAIELPTRKSLATADLKYVSRPDIVSICAKQAATISDDLVKQVTLPQFSTISTVLQDELERSFRGAPADRTQRDMAAAISTALA